MTNPSPAPVVLVVDDEENIRFLVTSGLELADIATIEAADGREALAMIEQHRPALVVLDVMMPELDGFDVVRRLRESGDPTPVIFLTARDETADVVAGLTSGADDYVVKPFAIAELIARVQLRLSQRGTTPASSVLRCADLELDDDAHRVTRAGEVVDLSPTEYRLLHVLLSNTGRVLSRAQLLEHVWNYDFDGDSSVVDTYISYLRRKLDQTPPKLIHTIRGIGYTIRVDA